MLLYLKINISINVLKYFDLHFIQAQIEKNDDIIWLYPTKSGILLYKISLKYVNMYFHNEKVCF